MIDWDRVDGFDWDTGNARKSKHKHDVSQPEAEQVFFNAPLLIVADPNHSQSKERFHALGRTETGRLLHLTFTVREDQPKTRVISARPVSRKERATYAQTTEENTPIQD